MLGFASPLAAVSAVFVLAARYHLGRHTMPSKDSTMCSAIDKSAPYLPRHAWQFGNVHRDPPHLLELPTRRGK
jgi:hypothetical protein